MMKKIRHENNSPSLTASSSFGSVQGGFPPERLFRSAACMRFRAVLAFINGKGLLMGSRSPVRLLTAVMKYLISLRENCYRHCFRCVGNLHIGNAGWTTVVLLRADSMLHAIAFTTTVIGTPASADQTAFFRDITFRHRSPCCKTGARVRRIQSIREPRFRLLWQKQALPSPLANLASPEGDIWHRNLREP